MEKVHLIHRFSLRSPMVQCYGAKVLHSTASLSRPSRVTASKGIGRMRRGWRRTQSPKGGWLSVGRALSCCKHGCSMEPSSSVIWTLARHNSMLTIRFYKGGVRLLGHPPIAPSDCTRKLCLAVANLVGLVALFKWSLMGTSDSTIR